MDTRFWGPDGWKLLHSIVENYPDYPSINEKKIYSIFFNSIKHVLPCIYCRRSLNDYMNELPIEKYINSKINLCYWLYLIHNKVNDKLGVPPCDIPSFSQVEKKYESYRAACKQTTDQDRSNSLIKGCTIPQTGIKKKCKILVVSDDDKAGKFDNYYYSILVGLCLVVGVVIIWLILVVLNNLK